MKIGDSVVLRGTIKGVTYGEYGFPHYLVTLPNGCETEFPKLYIEDLQQLDEPQPVKVPQYVAKKIDYFKKTDNWGLLQVMDYLFRDKEIKKWLEDKNNQEAVARAWLDGYEVEEEKKYYVRFKWIESSYSYLTFIKHLHAWTLADIKLDKKFRSEHTRKQLEDAEFGWVFDCPGIEMEEVEV